VVKHPAIANAQTVRCNFMTDYIYTDNLESKRLRTRKLTLDDVGLWAEFFEDKDAIEFLPNIGFPSTKERAKHWIEKQLGRYADNRYGLQALINKDTNEFIGQCGLLAQEVDGEQKVEVGYHIFKKHWGQGYAPEAAKLFIDFGFKNNQATSIISIINTGNVRSQKVALKNSLTKIKQTTWSNLDVFIYQIDKKSST
jgi:RimJ/RimL family protein N-acetyltransferase